MRCWVVSPFSRCRACERFGSVMTSQEQTEARVARPKVRQEVGAGVAIGDLDGARTQRQAGEFILGVGHA